MKKQLKEIIGARSGIVAIIVWIIASVDTIKSDMKSCEYYGHPYKFADSYLMQENIDSLGYRHSKRFKHLALL